MTSGVIYARLSDVRKVQIPGADRQAVLSEGINRQLRELRAHAEKLGVEIVEELVDEDLSASKKNRRPDFERLMEGIEQNRWEVVVLRSLDRWVRRPIELERIIEIMESSKVRIEAVHGRIDLRTREGRHSARGRTANAIDEAEAISERVTDWHADRIAEGQPYVGKAGYGYKPDKLTVDVEQAERIKEAARRVLDGEPLRSIASDWNRQGVPAPRARWRPQTIRRILVAPRTAGLREHRGAVIGEAPWPAILDRVTWERLVRFFNSPERKAMAPKDRRAHLLTGVAWCPGCEHGMNSTTSVGKRKYRCTTCFRSVSAPDLEEHVVGDLFAALDEPAWAKAWAGGEEVDVSAVVTELEALDAERADLVLDVAQGRMTAQEWRVVSAGIETRRKPLEALLERPGRSEWIGRGVELRDLWGEADVDWKRRQVVRHIEKVEILPARVGIGHFDPDRVSIKWR